MKNYLVILVLIIFICIPVMGFCGHDQGDDPNGADDLVNPDEVKLDILVDQNEDGEAPEKGHVIIKEDEEEYEDEDGGGGAPNLDGGKHDFKTIDGGTTDSLFDDEDNEALCWKLYNMSCSEWYFSQLEGGGGLLAQDAGGYNRWKNDRIKKISDAIRDSGVSAGVDGASGTEQEGLGGLDTTPITESGKGGIGITIDFGKIFGGGK
ncbi:hypothetical protein KJ708_07090 [bacterium]|nr:hypothetical protein [bacterium]MBU1917148.1 hypothetical protein [bacterium]